MSERHPQPHPVMAVLRVAQDSMIGGSSDWIHMPRGGKAACAYMPGKGCYRVTLDITVGHDFAEDSHIAGYVAETREMIRRQLS